MSGEWGLYVHIPFCQARCTYCDFNTVTGMGEDMHERDVKALIQELAEERLPDGSLASIYFGGGTPSLVDADLLGAVIDQVRLKTALAPRTEITVETNPGTVTAEKLSRWAQAGVNRLSIGAQALQNHHLSALNRIHDAGAIQDTVSLARNHGFSNISLDAIYGIPGQTLTEWQATVTGLLALSPDHLSLYALMVEEGTPLQKSLERGEQRLPLGDLVADMADWAEKALTDQGLMPYEISNYARPGFASRHNQLYWKLLPYLALGAGAHAYHPGRRWWNVRGVRRYMEMVEHGQDPVDGEEILTAAEEMREYLWLGLRQWVGVSVPAFSERFGCHPKEAFGPVWLSLGNMGLVAWHDSRIILTERGRDMANVVARALVDAPLALSVSP